MTAAPHIPLGDLVLEVVTWNPLKPGNQDQSFNYVDLSAVDQDLKAITGARKVSCFDAPSRARQIVQDRDILVSTVRPNLNGVALVPTELDGATASTGFCVIRPNPELLDSSYAFHWVKSPLFISSMVSQATGASYPAVSDRIVLDSRIPLPPLPEQRRIAAILDQADALRAKRREALAQLDQLTQSIFIEMFGGDHLSPVTASDKSPLHPKGWKWELLTDYARLATGHTPDREQEEYWYGDFPWVSLTDIRGLNGKWANHTSQNVTAAGIENSSAVLLPKGTVCFSRTASVGFVTIMGSDMATSQDFVNWVHGPNLDPVYLMHALMMSKPQLLALSTGSTHRTIYMRVVERFRALIPPLDLQRDFARMAAEIQTIVTANEMAMAKLDSLFSSLQHRAFRGEL